jgi:hypothetical protein
VDDRAARLAQHPGRLEVAAPRRVLHVMRAFRGRRAARREGVGRGLVRGEPPPRLRSLVDRLPHDPMAEGEAPRDLGGANQLAVHQPVERRQDLRLGHAGDVGDQVRLKALACNGGGLQQRELLRGQRANLLCQRRRDRGRKLELRELRGGAFADVGIRGGAHQLVHVEGVAAAHLVHPAPETGL